MLLTLPSSSDNSFLPESYEPNEPILDSLTYMSMFCTHPPSTLRSQVCVNIVARRADIMKKTLNLRLGMQLISDFTKITYCGQRLHRNHDGRKHRLGVARHAAMKDAAEGDIIPDRVAERHVG